MKYILCIVVVFLLSAQIPAAPALSLEAGLGASSITGSDPLVTSSEMKLGFCLRASFEQKFSDRFTLRTGVGFEPRGEKNNSFKRLDGYSEETVEELDILNLQIPVLAQVNFPFGSICINVFGGPELCIFLNGERRCEIISTFDAEGDSPARSGVAYDTTDFSRKMKMMDGGLRVGLGFEMNTGSFGAFIVRPSAYIGLVDILQIGYSDEKNANLKGKHQAFSLAIGYKFNINPKMNSAAANKSSSKKSSPAVKEDAGYNLDNYKNSSSQESSPGSEPASEVDDLE
ncbi:MAG TPA: outer membrane beta-barrel protein [Chitinispirillaceae bacterium]|nr:outer membrane beta-barrel protein [Chitinispirillaceae bacterium]